MSDDAAPTTVELEPPERLLARWGVAAAACATLGIRESRMLEDRATADDGGGNWAEMALAGDGRAAFYGLDHEYSDTTRADPPVDALERAPAWVPWPRLVALSQDDALGWCYWWQEGAWHRSPSAARADLEDGHSVAAPWVLTDAQAATMVAELGAPDIPRSAAAIAELLARAHGATLTAELLVAALSPRGEVTADAIDRGLAAAARAGLTPGAHSPLRAPAATADPVSPPPRRRRRRLSEDEHQSLVLAAMRQATELPRPVPDDSPALRRLSAWVAGHPELLDDTRSLVYMGCGNESSIWGLRPPYDGYDEATEIAGAVREAEADPRSGRWIWLSLTPESHSRRFGRPRVEVRRAYDHAPSWWPESSDESPWVSNLQREMQARDPQFWPAWVRLLDPDTAWEQI